MAQRYTLDHLKIAVVGHTNTGKTSLIRTLLRDFNFGEVQNAPSTTIDVSEVSLKSPFFALNFTDTPGFEDPIGLAEILAQDFPLQSKLDQVKRIQNFISNANEYPNWEQEIKILRAVLRVDCAFYVIDTREDILGKYEEELEILMQCGIPILPILNFTHSKNSKVILWESTLKTLSLHHYLSFDTIFPPRERRLYEKLASILNAHYAVLHQFLEFREQQDQLRYDIAISRLSDFFIDICILQVQYQTDAPPTEVNHALMDLVIQLENNLSASLLKLYQFEDADLQLYPLPITPLILSEDFFSMAYLLTFTERFGKGAVTGASVGVAADALVGFTTLGMASILGGLVGGISNTARHYSHHLYAYLKGYTRYGLNHALIIHLFERMKLLLLHLEGRSHANLDEIRLTSELVSCQNLNKYANKFGGEFLLKLAQKIQSNADYSSLNKSFALSQMRRALKKDAQKLIEINLNHHP